MGRRKKTPAWGETRTVIKRNDRNDLSKKVEVKISYQPKGLTKGLKRQIRTLLVQNPQEAERQMAILGVKESDVAKKKRR